MRGLATLGLAIALSAAAGASTLHVDDDGTCGGNLPCYTTIQAAIDAASPGDTINVYPGSYNETATNRFVLGSNGPYQFGLFIDKAGLTIQGVDAGGEPITSAAAIAAFVTTNATNSFGYSGTFVQADGVTITGLEFGQNLPGTNKTIEVIGDNLTIKYCRQTDGIGGGGGSLYFNDWQFNVTSHIQSYHIEGCVFLYGNSIDFTSGAGLDGPVPGRKILNNTFDMTDTYSPITWPVISFNGSNTGVPWFVQSVGGAVITGNTFVDGPLMYIRARGDYDNSQFDWESYWNDNAFDKAVVALVDEPTFDVRGYTYTSGSYTFNNTRRIGTTIQAEIDNASAGDTVLVAAGTYAEDVALNKALTLQGAGASLATIRGVKGGSSATVQASASGATTIDGFTITREGNTVSEWNDATLNSAGLAIQGLTVGPVEVRNCVLTGNRTGIDVNNSNGHSIHNNVITFNRTGLIFRNQTDNLIVEENEITDNWTVGVLFLDASGGSNSPVQTAANCSFFNNKISGNWYGQIVDRQTGGSLPAPGANLKNFSGNWLGSTTPVVSTANSAEPGYADQIPVAYGGTAVPPGGQPDILGAASGNVDYTPWLGTGTDDDGVEFAFQGDFSTLWVDDNSPQTGADGRVQEAANLVSGSTINVLPGLYEEQVVIDEPNLVLDGAGDGTNPAVDSIIRAPATPLAWSFSTGANNNYPVIGVHDALNVTIRDLRIDGYGRGNGNYRFLGIGYWNADGEIRDCTVTGIRETPLSGTQHGVGIYSWNSGGGPYTLDVIGTTVEDYQKNGMTIGGAGVTANVVNCDVYGSGPLGLGLPAQNGIQFSGLVAGSISDTLVRDHMYTPGTWAACGVLIFGPGGTIAISDTELYDNFPGLYASDASATLTGCGIRNLHADSGDGLYADNATTSLMLHGGGSVRVVPSALDAELMNGNGDARAATLVTVTHCEIVGHDEANSWGLGAFSTGTQTSGLLVTQSTIRDWDLGIVGYYDVPNGYDGPVDVDAHGNIIVSNVTAGAANLSPNVMDATGNYWGATTGPLDLASDVGELVELGACTSNPASEFNANGGGSAVDDTSVAAVDFCPWLLSASTVSLLPQGGDVCYDPSDTLVVEIKVHDLTVPIVGAQFFLNYDTTKLTYAGGIPGDAPWAFEFADLAPPPLQPANTIFYSVGTGIVNPPSTTADAVVARLTFTVNASVSACQVAGLVGFQADSGPFQNKLSDEFGNAVWFAQNALPPISVDDTNPVITCPPNVTIGADPGLCVGTLSSVDPFDDPVCTAPAQTPSCWYVDRYTPAGFTNAVLGGENVLKLSIAGADALPNRSLPYQSTFYNTQGRKYDVNLPLPATLTGKLYVASDWATNVRRSDLWGTTNDSTGAVSGYPIAGFINNDPTDPLNPSATNLVPRFRVWMDEGSGGWVDLGLPPGFLYDQWVTIEIDITAAQYVYTIVTAQGNLTYTYPKADEVVRVADVMVQAYNFGNGSFAPDYDAYWDNVTIGPRGPIATDNCCLAAVTGVRSDSLPLSAPYPVGPTTITWTATDCCGNTSLPCVQTITVVDDEPPVVVASTIDACYDTALDAEADALAATTATDNCGLASETAATLGTCDAIVTVTVTDIHGNVAYATYYTRIDNTPPTLPDPNDITVNNDAGLCSAVVNFTLPAVTDDCESIIAHFEGFESAGFTAPPITPGYPNWQQYNSNVYRVASGTGGVSSKGGVAHALLDSTSLPPQTGAFTRLGGYSSVWGGGFKTSVDVYIDLSDPAVAAKTYGFDISSAASNQSGGHRRDFVFHAAADDNSYPGNVLIAASNNSSFTKRNDLDTLANKYVIQSSGWYTFEWVFRDNGSGVLAVDCTLRDADGAWLFTETRSDPSDVIATAVGGNRYMWFTFLAVDTLPIDNTRLVRNTGGPAPTVVAAPLSGSVFPVGTTPVLVTATDACGNSSQQTFNVTVVDTELPTISCNQTDINVPADAGGCTANVTWNAATASDNCSFAITHDIDLGNNGSVDVTQAGTTYAFPAGTHKVTAKATDPASNTATCFFLVTVQGVSELKVYLALEGVGVNVNRCITFDLWDGVSSTTVNAVIPFTAGVANSVVIPVPCGNYICISARDKLHTMRRTISGAPYFTVAAQQYVADFISAGKILIGGNLNDDQYIDILDFGVYAWQYAANYGSPNTTCSTPYPHADISADSVVLVQDFTYIQTHFLAARDAACSGAALAEQDDGPLTSIAVEDLDASGLGELAAGDLNGDGTLDVADVQAFLSGARPGPRLGDANCDGGVSFVDIDAFVLALSGPQAYAAQYPGCNWLAADANGDGMVNFFDIDPFVDVLSAGQ